MLSSLFKSRFKQSLAHLIVSALAAGQLATAHAQDAQAGLQPDSQRVQATAKAIAPIALNPRLARIAERYFEDHLALNPLEASSMTGEARFDGLLTITIAPAQLAKQRALSVRVLKRLAGLDVKKLASADQMTFAVLKRQLEEQLDGSQFPSQLMPIDQYGGLPVYVAQLGSGQDIQPLKTVKNYDDYLARLNKLPQWIDQAIVNMREGIQRGIVQPKPLMVSGLPAIKALAERDIEKSVFYVPIKNMPVSVSNLSASARHTPTCVAGKPSPAKRGRYCSSIAAAKSAFSPSCNA